MTDKNRKLWLDTRGVPVITTTKNGEANAIRWGWTEAKAVAADALTTRVPVQGEPNDDREALLALIGEHQPILDHLGRGSGSCKCGAFTSDQELHLMQMITAAGFSRATVPDAATELAAIKARAEEVDEDEGWHIGGAWGDYGEVVVPLRILSYVVDGALDQKIVSTDPGYAATYAEQVARADKAEAERDAALAAVERVRALVSEQEAETTEIDIGKILAALDGAPEPAPADDQGRAMQIAQAIARAHTFSTPTALSIAEVALNLAVSPAPARDEVDWRAIAHSADEVIRATLRELGAGPEADPVLKAREVKAKADAAPARVNVETALRFCTCSHWLEAHHERECLEYHCACKDFTPVYVAPARDEWEEGEREKIVALVRDLIDPDDCYFDHHGGCQAHGYLSLQPGQLCPHAEAKAWLPVEGEKP